MRTTNEITAKQQSVLDFITRFQVDNECSPTMPEIQAHFHLRSYNSDFKYLQALEKKGAIVRRGTSRKRQHRSIAFTAEAKRQLAEKWRSAAFVEAAHKAQPMYLTGISRVEEAIASAQLAT